MSVEHPQQQFRITTDMLSPQQEGLSLLRLSTLESGIIDRSNSAFRQLTKTALLERPEFFMSRQGKELRRQVNESIYTSLEEKFGLTNRQGDPNESTQDRSETGYSFWRRHMQIANTAVNALRAELLPNQEKRFGLKNEVSFIQDPASVFWMLTSPHVDEKLKFELRRQVTIAMASAQLELENTLLSEKLGELQRWLDLDLFDHGQLVGQGEDRTVLYTADPYTNEVLSVEGADGNPYTPSNLPERTTQKMQVMGMRHAADIGWVVTLPRLKDDADAVNKSIRNALESERKNKGNQVDATKVKDRGGIMFVASEEFGTDSQKVAQLQERFKQIVAKHFNLDVEHDFEEDNSTNGKANQSPRFKVKRLAVNLPDLPYPVEVMFVGIGDQLNNDSRVGNYDVQTGSFDGQAHPLYKLRRDLDVLRLYFPKELYGDIDFNQILRSASRAKANELLRSHQVGTTID